MRRMTGRSPPFAIIGVIVIFTFLSFNLWTAYSRNDDFANELEKLQVEIKICAAKQVESEKAESHLQENINELQSKLSDSKKYVEEDRNVLKKTGDELLNLKNEKSKLHKIEGELKEDLEVKDAKILEVKKRLDLIADLKDDADLVIAEKDQQINKLQLQLEQAKHDLHQAYAKENSVAKLKKHSRDEKKKSYMPKGLLKEVPPISVRSTNKGMSGFIEHPELTMLPQEPADVVRNIPKFSVGYVTTKPRKEQNNQVQGPRIEQGDINQLNNVQNVIHNPETLKQESDNNINDLHLQQVIQKPILLPESNAHEPIYAVLNLPPQALKEDNYDANVIPLPPQNLAENPDTAIDEEEKNVDDPADDQDEEGKEIKHDMEALPGGGEEGKKNFDEFNNNIDYEEGNERNGLQKHVIPKGENPEPRGIGLMGFPRSKDIPAGEDFVNFGGDPDHNEVKANDRLYETNFSNKIRNIGKM